jgi:hypothetical protein
MFTRCKLAVAALVGLGFIAGTASAATFRVDDSASIPYESTVTLRYPRGMPSKDLDSPMDGTLSLRVRLHVARWQKQQGKLYLVLPEQGMKNVTARWTTTGRLLSGSIAPGQRKLVFSGVVDAPFIDDTMQITIASVDTELDGRRRLAFHFEIDID